MLLKFSYTEDGSIEDFRGDILSSSDIGPTISLQSIKACLIDITSDPRTKLLNKHDMVSERLNLLYFF